MNLDDIKKMNELVEMLKKAASAWNASFDIKLESELVIHEMDTSLDGYDSYKAGAITQITVPKLYIRYSMVQDKMTKEIIPIPILVDHSIPAIAHAIEFHTYALKCMLVDYAPTELDWPEAYQDASKNHEL